MSYFAHLGISRRNSYHPRVLWRTTIEQSPADDPSRMRKGTRFAAAVQNALRRKNSIPSQEIRPMSDTGQGPHIQPGQMPLKSASVSVSQKTEPKAMEEDGSHGKDLPLMKALPRSATFRQLRSMTTNQSRVRSQSDSACPSIDGLRISNLLDSQTSDMDRGDESISATAERSSPSPHNVRPSLSPHMSATHTPDSTTQGTRAIGPLLRSIANLFTGTADTTRASFSSERSSTSQPKRGDVQCLSYTTLDDHDMALLDARSDHRSFNLDQSDHDLISTGPVISAFSLQP